jgi:hypothetical protein
MRITKRRIKMESTTTDFSKFGYREREMAEQLLKASREQGFPEDFEDNETTIMFNLNSGNVFFTNSDYQVSMLTDDGKLESFYSCPECGHEGFKEEMKHEGNKECKRYLKDIGVTK